MSQGEVPSVEGYLFSDERDIVAKRARDAGLKATLSRISHFTSLKVEFRAPDGKALERGITKPIAKDMVGRNFEDWVFLPSGAVLDKSLRTIEAPVIVMKIRDKEAVRNSFERVEGYEKIDDGVGDDSTAGRRYGAGVYEEPVKRAPAWRLPFEGGPGRVVVELASGSVAVELGPPAAGPEFGYRSIPRVLKMHNIDTTDPDEAENFLQRTAANIFFELAVRNDILLRLRGHLEKFEMPRYRSAKRTPRPVAPRNDLKPEAVQLYMHAKSPSLVETYRYLAFYQAIETFFPYFFSRRATLRVKKMLRDPGFDSSEDDHIHSLLDLVKHHSPKRPRDEEQLEVTLAECLDGDSLNSFIQSMGGEAGQFFRRADRLGGGMPTMDVRKANDTELLATVAKRVTAIRNRIVHAKLDDPERGRAVLFPFTPEVADLEHDLTLIEHIAREVIVTAAAM